MKAFFRYIMLSIGLSSSMSCASQNQIIPTNNKSAKQVSVSPKWKLIWSDEFNYTGLPDSSKWGYEVGFVRNKENQYYTKARKKNVYVHNGYLEIKGIKEEYPNAYYKAGTNVEPKSNAPRKLNIPIAHYTSASINTLGKFDVLYGKIEMRAMLPQGKGTWPAFWMMGIDRQYVGWPYCGEIDIMEELGREPGNIYTTVHYPGKDGKKPDADGGKINLANLYNRYHTYAVEWTPKKMVFLVDNKPVYTSEMDKHSWAKPVFEKPFYILINLALGGGWGKKIDDSMLPQSYKVDYVRVYQKDKGL